MSGDLRQRVLTILEADGSEGCETARSTLIPFELSGDRVHCGDPHVTEGETDPSPARSTGSVDPAAGDLTDRCVERARLTAGGSAERSLLAADFTSADELWLEM